MLEEKNMSLAAIQAAHESEINNLGLELEKERDKLANIQLKLQGSSLLFQCPVVISHFVVLNFSPDLFSIPTGTEVE